MYKVTSGEVPKRYKSGDKNSLRIPGAVLPFALNCVQVASSITLFCHNIICQTKNSVWLFCCSCIVNPIVKLKILSMKARIFLSISALTVATFLIVSCYKSKSSYNGTPGTSKITITSSAYSPASLTVVSGATVTWTNNDNSAHTVTTEDG